MSHFDACRASVLDYADGLIHSIKDGKLNAEAFDGLINGYLDQPAYHEQDKPELRRLAKERIKGW